MVTTLCSQSERHNVNEPLDPYSQRDNLVTMTTKKIAVAQAAAAAATAVIISSTAATTRNNTSPKRNKPRRLFRAIERTRRSVRDVYKCLGEHYFWRAYRMSYASFCTLEAKLRNKIIEVGKCMHKSRRMLPAQQQQLRKKGNYYTKKKIANTTTGTTPTNHNYKPPPVPNGTITVDVRLACALRYFAGGSPYKNLMVKYGISYTSVLESVWNAVEALNGFPDFYIKYPADQNIQKQIAAEFHSASSVGFKNCAGAVNGILIWIHRPSKADADKEKIGVKKLFCGRKKIWS
jgi:hypothetical protein